MCIRDSLNITGLQNRVRIDPGYSVLDLLDCLRVGNIINISNANVSSCLIANGHFLEFQLRVFNFPTQKGSVGTKRFNKTLPRTPYNGLSFRFDNASSWPASK